MIRSKRLLAFLALTLTVLLALHGILWYRAADQLKAGALAWIASREAEGVRITSQALDVVGYPFRLEVRLTGVTVQGLPRLTGVLIEAPIMTASGRLWNPLHWRLGTAQGLTLTGEHGPRIALGAAEGRLDLTEPEADLRLGLTDLVFAAAGGDVTAPHADLHFVWGRAKTEQHIAFDGAINFLRLPIATTPLPDAIDRISLAASLQGSVPPGPLRPALTAWRDHGGTIEVTRAELVWGPLDIHGDGTVALDEVMQPLAAFGVEITGWSPVLHGMASAKIITEEQAGFFGAGLSLLARRGPDGRDTLKTHLTVQHGQLAIGPAKLLAVPPIPWE